MEELKEKIGITWESLEEMQEDLSCYMEGIVEFGQKERTPFSSSWRMEIYNDEEESYILEFLEEDGEVELLAVY